VVSVPLMVSGVSSGGTRLIVGIMMFSTVQSKDVTVVVKTVWMD